VDLGLRGRNALVGGASAGLGRSSAEHLAAEGCRLVLWSRGGEALQRAADEIRRKHGVEVTTIGADATDPATAPRVAEAAEKALGHVDIVILNAGGPPPSAATNTDQEEWHRAFQLLALTPIELTTLVLPGMRARKWGRIVSIMSSGIRNPIPELVYSGACRSALAAFLKTISLEVAADGVTVNGVLPGRFATDRVAMLDEVRAQNQRRRADEVRADFERAIPAGRYGEPDELGAYVAWLCSDLARYQTGTFVPIDGGSLRTLP